MPSNNGSTRSPSPTSESDPDVIGYNRFGLLLGGLDKFKDISNQLSSFTDTLASGWEKRRNIELKEAVDKDLSHYQEEVSNYSKSGKQEAMEEELQTAFQATGERIASSFQSYGNKHSPVHCNCVKSLKSIKTLKNSSWKLPE